MTDLKSFTKNFFNSIFNYFKIPLNLKSVSFLKNTGFVMFSKLFESVISYVIIILISRYLGAEGLGQYSFIFSFGSLFFLLSDLGISTLLVKDLAKSKKNLSLKVSNGLFVSLILSLASFSIYLISLLFINKPELKLALIFVGLISTFGILRLSPLSILIVKEKGFLISLIDIIERILALIGSIFFLYFLRSLTGFVIFLSFSMFVRFILTLILSRRLAKFSIKFNKSVIYNLVKKSYPFILIAIFTFIYVQLDTVMLAFMKTDAVVGWYNASYKLINIMNLLPTVILIFGFPLASNLIKNNKSAAKKLFQNMINFTFLILTPVILAVWFFGNRVLDFIYGFNSIESFIAFKILIIAELFVFLSAFLGQFISANDDQLFFAKVAGFGAVVNIILNFLLIPKFSLYGAAASTLTTYFIMFLILFVKLNSFFKISILKPIILPLLSSLLLIPVFSYISHMHLVYIILISVFCYLLFYLIFFLLKNSFIKSA